MKVKWFFSILAFISTLTMPCYSDINSLIENPRMEICLNGNWQWVQGKFPSFSETSQVVRVPGAMQFDDMTLETCAWYRQRFILPDVFKDSGARWLLHVGKAGWYSKVLINGQRVGENFGSIVPFELDVTEKLNWGRENELLIYVHSADIAHTLPGQKLDDLHEAVGFRSGGRHHRNWTGIQGDVKLLKRPPTRIHRHKVETSVRNKTISVRGMIISKVSAGKPNKVQLRVYDIDSGDMELDASILLDKDKSNFERQIPWEDAVRWGFGEYGQPKLYALELNLFDDKDRQIDTVVSRFGFREIWYEGRKLMFNGKELMLAAATIPYGTERFPTYLHPYGTFERNQMTRYFQVLRHSGFNGFHNHFDTIGDSIYDVADEIGMLIVAGAYCNGPGWLTPSTGMHQHWPTFMHGTLTQWTQNTGRHSSVVLWNPVCGIPQDLSGRGLKAAFDELDYGGAIEQADGTRPIVGHNVDYIKHGIDQIREEAKKTFKDNNKPRFVKEVWALDENWDVAHDNVKKLLEFFRSEEISGFVSFGKTFGIFDFDISWPSDSGTGIHWSRTNQMFAFKSWINWCDESKPLCQSGQIAKDLSEQYEHFYGNPGLTEPLVYPQVLTHNHSKEALYMAIEPAAKFKPELRVVLLDKDLTGYANILYPGQTRIYEISGKDVNVKDVLLKKTQLPYKPGYQNLVKIDWSKN